MGMRSSGSFKTDFTGVEIGPENVIGRPGDYYREPWFSGGSVRFAAVQLGGAEALFDLTREYLQELGRIDDPYQKQRIGEMAILIESGELWLQAAGTQLDNYMSSPGDEASKRFLAYANMMRTAIGDTCMRTIELCQTAVGARGLNRPFHMERVIRDLMIYLRQPGPDAALANVGEFSLTHDMTAGSLWKPSR